MYQALYRKYRPKTFDDVVGQDFVIQILKNEILNNKVNHAYMFFGPRGIGKTTIAKIFARAVNCENSKDGSPCEKCSSCQISKEKECVDIIEIDAASNNGVDEIREIRSKVNLVPAELKYKVYIIDEVHMLTQGAFNALLKTLEEPPEHIIFILATTDPQKVSETIISRCQCFSFKRISEQENIRRLKEICEKEKIDIDDQVLEEISLYSDGGLRDSLGLLDKLSSYKSGKIVLNDFYEMNDMIDSKSLEELLNSIELKNISNVIESIEKYNELGKNIIEIMNQLIYYLKQQVVEYYVDNKKYDNIDFREKLLQYINENMFDIKKTSKPYIYVEILMLKFINDGNICDNDSKQTTEVVNKIEEENNSNKKVTEIVEKEEKSISQIGVEENVKKESTEIVNKTNELKEIMKIRLNNAFAEASKTEKSNDLKLIDTLNDYVFDSEKGFAASEILNANLCVSSKDILVLSYEYDAVVDQNLENISKLNEIYNQLTNSSKKLAIISNKYWEQEKNKYIQFTKQGNKYKIIEEPKLQAEDKEIDVEENPAVELFGDIVEIK